MSGFGEVPDSIRTPARPSGTEAIRMKLVGARDAAARSLQLARLEEIKAYMNEKRRVLARALAGEFLATFIFLFVVLSTHLNLIRSNADSTAIVGGISTAFVAVAVIYSFADVSGAHFNPAVTFGTMVMGKTSWRKGLAYMLAQLLGGIMATLFLYIVFPDDGQVVQKTVVNIYADTNLAHAVATEFILTFILVYVIFAVAFDTVDSSNRVQIVPELVRAPEQQVDEEQALTGLTPEQQELMRQPLDTSIGRNLTIYTTSGSTKAGFAPIAIGFTLGFLCFIGGSTSGGAFNPARVFGPSFVANQWQNHWVYWLGDFAGAAFAGFVQSFFMHKPTQTASETVNKQQA